MRVLLAAAVLLSALVPAAAARPGDADRNFGRAGQVRLPMGSYSEVGDMALDSKGRVLASGECCEHDDGIVRLTRRGRLDRTFAARGVRVLNRADNALIEVDRRDRILLFEGVHDYERPPFVRVRRFVRDGELDRRYGRRGKRILVAGSLLDARGFRNGGALIHTARDEGSRVTRLSPAGRVLWRTDVGLHFNFRGLGVSPSGVVLVAGSDPAGAEHAFQIARIDASGTLLPATRMPRLPAQSLYARVTLAAGRVHAYAVVAHDGRLYVMRLLRDGTLDVAFGDGGLKVLDAPRLPDGAAAQVDRAGRLLVAGTDYSSGSARFALARLTPGGELDRSFGAGGVRLINAGRLIRSYAASLTIDHRRHTVTLGGAASDESGGFREDFGSRHMAFARFKLR